MQPVRTKKRAGLGKKRILWIALGALLILGVVIWLLTRPAAQPEQPEEEAVSLTLVDRGEEELAQITVHPRRSDPYTLVAQDGSWVLEGEAEYPMRAETVKVLVGYAAHLTADELAVRQTGVSTSHRGRVSLADYGLDPAACTVDVTLGSGEQYTISLGSAVPMEEVRYYAAVSGDQNVYTVTSDVMDALNVPFYALHTVPSLAIDGELIDRIAVTDEDGKAEFALERTGAAWVLTAPFRYPASADKVESLLSALENLRFSTWVGEDTTMNRHKYRLGTSMSRLRLDFAPSVLTVPDEEGNDQTFDIPASNITLILGGAYSDTADYYIYDGEILTGTTVTFSAVRRLAWNNYAVPNPFVYGQNNLSEVTVESDGTETRYEIRYVERVLPNNQFETDEYGNTVFEMRVRKNGQDADAYAFSEYYARLTSLDGTLPRIESSEDGEVWRPTGSDVPIVAVRVTAEDGKSAMTAELYSGPMGRLYLAVDGVSVYTVPQSWADAFLACP